MAAPSPLHKMVGEEFLLFRAESRGIDWVLYLSEALYIVLVLAIYINTFLNKSFKLVAFLTECFITTNFVVLLLFYGRVNGTLGDGDYCFYNLYFQ